MSDEPEPEVVVVNTVIGKKNADDALLVRCAELYSQHYGNWSAQGPAPGQPMQLSAAELRQQLLFNDDTFIVVAQVKGHDILLGYATGTKFYDAKLRGPVLWITQLVTHTDARQQGVGSRLCYTAWNANKDCFACGLVSSCPYAVKALQTAVGYLTAPKLVLAHGQSMLQQSGIPHLQGIRTSFNAGRCVVDSQHFVSHHELQDMLDKVHKDWELGSALAEGEEFVAICFGGYRNRKSLWQLALPLLVPACMAIAAWRMRR